MLLAFISDIHANLEALEAVMNDIKKRNVDRIYCLGDLVGYGPDPEETVKKLIDIPTVAGNYDDGVGYSRSSCGCQYNPGRETEVGEISINWTVQNTSEEVKSHLRSLKHRMEFEVEGVNFLLVHGSPLNELFEYVTPEIDQERLKKFIEKTTADVIINGHTHLPMVKCVNGKLIMNAGSVGRPKDGDPRSCYLLVEVKKGVLSYEFVRIAYDVKKTCEKIAQVGLPAELAVVISLGCTYDMGKSKIMRNFFVV